MTSVRRGNNYDGTGCAFAVKPRAFGAPQAALGLDRSAQPSKGTAIAANAIKRRDKMTQLRHHSLPTLSLTSIAPYKVFSRRARQSNRAL
jgi:hypothetical protein